MKKRLSAISAGCVTCCWVLSRWGQLRRVAEPNPQDLAFQTKRSVYSTADFSSSFCNLVLPLWCQRWGGGTWTPWRTQTTPCLCACRTWEETRRLRSVETPEFKLLCSKTCGSIQDPSALRRTWRKRILWKLQRCGFCKRADLAQNFTNHMFIIPAVYSSVNHPTVFSPPLSGSRSSLMTLMPSTSWCRRRDWPPSPSRSKPMEKYSWQRSWTEKLMTWYITHA